MNYKVIDFERKGNLVRFYLGDENCTDYHGDDWDDIPYEHNAGTVYDEFIKGHIDAYFPFEYAVLEPANDYRNSGNSPWCKLDMVSKSVPCIVALREEETFPQWEDCFSDAVANANAIRFYFGFSVTCLSSAIEACGGHFKVVMNEGEEL